MKSNDAGYVHAKDNNRKVSYAHMIESLKSYHKVCESAPTRDNNSIWLHVYWKHTLETLSFGNIIRVWKHNLYIGNITFMLETWDSILEIKHLET